MNKLSIAILLAGVLAGCAPTSFMQPTFPAVPPEKPAKVETEKPRASTKSERAPITAKDVSEGNVRQIVRDLEAELEQDANDTGGRD